VLHEQLHGVCSFETSEPEQSNQTIDKGRRGSEPLACSMYPWRELGRRALDELGHRAHMEVAASGLPPRTLDLVPFVPKVTVILTAMDPVRRMSSVVATCLKGPGLASKSKWQWRPEVNSRSNDLLQPAYFAHGFFMRRSAKSERVHRLPP
jgi:hypothetical protein